MFLTLRLSYKDAKILAVCRNPCYCVVGTSAEVPGRCTKRQAVSYTIPKGGGAMRITLHIGRFTVTIIVKSKDRHSAK